MTDEEKVRQKYPNAAAQRPFKSEPHGTPRVFVVYDHPFKELSNLDFAQGKRHDQPMVRALGVGLGSADAAWADAARRLEKVEQTYRHTEGK